MTPIDHDRERSSVLVRKRRTRFDRRLHARRLEAEKIAQGMPELACHWKMVA